MFFRNILFTTICFITVALLSCGDDENDAQPVGRFNFSLKNENLHNGSGQLQSASFVLFSIETVSGDQIYTLEKSPLNPSQDGYTTDPIQLPSGNYNLAEFFVLHENEAVLFASPRSGSALAAVVEKPLSISVEISTDHTASIGPEIVTTENSLPQDFG